MLSINTFSAAPLPPPCEFPFSGTIAVAAPAATLSENTIMRGRLATHTGAGRGQRRVEELNNEPRTDVGHGCPTPWAIGSDANAIVRVGHNIPMRY
jgi:hypothetical protein